MAVSPFRIKTGSVIKDGSSAVSTLAGSGVSFTPLVTASSGVKLNGGSAANGVVWYGSSAIQFGNNVGSVTDAGAWTFPVNTTHTFGNSSTAANTALSLNTETTKNAFIALQRGGTTYGFFGVTDATSGIVTGSGVADNDICIATNSTKLLFSTDYGTTIHGQISAGAWTLGPVSTTPAISTHAVYGAMAAFFDGANPVTCTTTAATGSARQMIRFRLGATTPLGGTNSGGITATDGTTSPAFYTGSSDRRLKKDIQDAPSGALNRICSVRLRDFRMTEDDDSAPLKRGVIAQELAEVYPEKVHTRDDGFLYVSMGYDWEFIQAIQELSAKLDSLQESRDALRAELDAEKARNDALEARLIVLENK